MCIKQTDLYLQQQHKRLYVVHGWSVCDGSDCREKRAKSHATSPVAGCRLWQLSAQLCDVTPQLFTSIRQQNCDVSERSL